jgi:hypothetical protein
MNRDIIYGWLGGHMVQPQHRTALLDPASAAISNRQMARLEIAVTSRKHTPHPLSNRQSSGRGGRQHSRAPAQRASTVSGLRHTPFLIRYQQLEFNVNHSKQTPAPISNPQKRGNMFSRKCAESASRLSPFSAFSLNRFRFAIISNRNTTEFKKRIIP